MPRAARPRNVFLFVSGRTPQIITETLFFFLVHHRPPIRPHEIHVLTTTAGHELICEQLLGGQTSRFGRFCREYGLTPSRIRFSAHTVEVLRDETGQPLLDIRTDTDNRAAADQIVAKVRALTRDPTTRLFASMAGGRKTMGLYLGLALQFYGRLQDRLTHVLINPPELENNLRFFYPAARNTGRVRQPSITVAEVPLVLLGHKLPVLRDREDLDYGALVTQSQREVDLLITVSPVTIDPVGFRLRIGEACVSLSGLEFTLYTLVARKRQQAACQPACLGCGACTVGAADFLDPAMIHTIEQLAAEVGVRDPRLRELGWWKEGEGGKQRFLQVCARIKKKLRAVLGEASAPYMIAPLHTRPERVARYTIPLNKGLLRLSELATLPA